MENPVQLWIQSNEQLARLLEEIETSGLPESKQAELALDKLCEMLDLPKTPADLERYADYYQKHQIDEPRSVFEENALLNYLYPEEDPRGILLAAVYNVKHHLGVDLDEIAAKEFGADFPDGCLVGIKGNGIYGEVVFPQKEGKSWVDLGCITVTKIVRLEH